MAKYIDADKLIKAMKKTAEITGRFGDAVNAFEACVKLMPAADVVEVKHGKWIERENNYDTDYDCSVCSESFVFIDGDPIDNLYQHCPNCGAKMDGKE